MKHLVVTTTYPQYRGDPRGEFVSRHWEPVALAGHSVRILAPRTRWTRDDLHTACTIARFTYAPRWLSSLTGRHGILENVRESWWRALLLPSLVRSLQRAVRRELTTFAPDLVTAHMLLPGGWVVAHACREAGVPFELFGHGTDVDVALRMPPWLRRAFVRDLAAARVLYLPSHEKRCRVAPLFADTRLDLRVEPMLHVVAMPELAAPRAVTRSHVEPRILFVGRLIRQKGVDDLLHAVARLDPIPRLHIAGDGPERRVLQRLAQELRIPAQFHGFVTGTRKQDLFVAADLVCVPSRETRGGLSEGAPLVVREAFAHGLPVVASHTGGIPELCRDGGSATLVPPGQREALARALADVLRVRGYVCSVTNPPSAVVRGPLRRITRRSLRDAG